jgi:transcriptional regulator with XRE-family HTH domain
MPSSSGAGGNLDSRELFLSFGQTVRDRRRSLGLSQEQLADLAGLHRTYVGSIERGERNPSLLNIARLANALRVQPRDLVPDVPRGRARYSLRQGGD